MVTTTQDTTITAELLPQPGRAPAISPVLSALRICTKEKHSILDASMPLANPEADWLDYIDHLQLLFAWLSPLEDWLGKYHDGPQAKEASTYIRYNELILRDLNGADIYPTVQHEESWQRQDGAAYRWGICYVIEGSQLGGEFLYKRLSARLAPRALSYLQTKQPGRWPRFLQTMARNVITPQDIDSACAGAMDAFDALLRQLPERDYL